MKGGDPYVYVGHDGDYCYSHKMMVPSLYGKTMAPENFLEPSFSKRKFYHFLILLLNHEQLNPLFLLMQTNKPHLLLSHIHLALIHLFPDFLLKRYFPIWIRPCGHDFDVAVGADDVGRTMVYRAHLLLPLDRLFIAAD